ncbi:MAG TPA: hypothetical protein VI318_13890 [Baekduia sp.]
MFIEPAKLAPQTPVNVIVQLTMSALTGVTSDTVTPVTLSLDVFVQEMGIPPMLTIEQPLKCGWVFELMTNGNAAPVAPASVAVTVIVVQSTEKEPALTKTCVVAVAVTAPPGDVDTLAAVAGPATANVITLVAANAANSGNLNRIGISYRNLEARHHEMPRPIAQPQLPAPRTEIVSNMSDWRNALDRSALTSARAWSTTHGSGIKPPRIGPSPRPGQPAADCGRAPRTDASAAKRRSGCSRSPAANVLVMAAGIANANFGCTSAPACLALVALLVVALPAHRARVPRLQERRPLAALAHGRHAHLDHAGRVPAGARLPTATTLFLPPRPPPDPSLHPTPPTRDMIHGVDPIGVALGVLAVLAYRRVRAQRER